MLAAARPARRGLAGLQRHAHDRGIVFLSTPFDDGVGRPARRASACRPSRSRSGELTNLPFLARLAARGRPLLLSTGMADMVEVAAAVDTIAAAGDPPLALFHCVSSYPAAPRTPTCGPSRRCDARSASRRLVGPHARDRLAVAAVAAGADARREAPDARSDAARARPRRVARARRVRGDGPRPSGDRGGARRRREGARSRRSARRRRRAPEPPLAAVAAGRATSSAPPTWPPCGPGPGSRRPSPDAGRPATAGEAWPRGRWSSPTTSRGLA